MSDFQHRWSIPNIMTLARLVAIPFFIAVFYLPYQWASWATATIFVLAAITDWLDGYLARKLNQSSRFGAFLDPVVDKLMVAAALVMLVQSHPTIWMAAAAIVIISREIAVSALREWMAELGLRNRVAVSYIGKVKTVFQMIALTGLLAIRPGRETDQSWLFSLVLDASYIMLYLATALTLWSMFIYLKAAWPELWPTNKQSRDVKP